jgi:DNA-binding NtrC family response regulator
MESLVRYPWPGNVRELQNVVHRAMLACEGSELHLGHLPVSIRTSGLTPIPSGVQPTTSPSADIFPKDSLSLREIEKRAIEEAMHRSAGRVGQAAKLLGIGRATLYRRLAELDPRHAERDAKLDGDASCPQ